MVTYILKISSTQIISLITIYLPVTIQTYQLHRRDSNSLTLKMERVWI